MTEILSIFNEQSSRIKMLEEKIETLAAKEYVDRLSVEIGEVQVDYSQKFTNLQDQIIEKHEIALNQIKEFKEWVENENIAAVGESRRMILFELENYTPHIDIPPFPEIPDVEPLKEKIAELEKQLPIMRNDIDSIVVPKATETKSIDEIAAIRVATAERAIKAIQEQLKTYPKMETDISDMMLTFPLLARRLDSRVNEFVANYEGATKNSQAAPRVNFSQQPSTHADDSANFPIYQPHVETDILPELDPNSIPPPFSAESEKEDIEEIIDSIPTTPKRKLNKNNSQVTSLLIKPVENDGNGHESVVKVIEKRKYKTELNASMRVVSEIEWLKNMVTQHHNSIRSCQQGLKTQQDNFDTVTENILRVNTTHNSRISQLAQQQLLLNQSNDAFQKQILEKLNAFNVKVENIKAQEPKIIEIPVQSPVQTSQHSPSSKTKIIKIMPDPLPPLRDPEMDEEEEEEEEEKDEPQIKDVAVQTLPEKQEEKEPAIPKSESRIRKFAFEASELTTEVDIPMEEKKDPTPPVVHEKRPSIQTFSTRPLQQSKQVIADRAAKQEAPTAILPPPEAPQKQRQPNPIYDVHYIERAQFRNRMNSDVDIESLISPELIEEKVTMFARKVVTMLADNARADIRKQSEVMKKDMDKVVSLVDNKIDREFVEKMFNKFRVTMGDLNEKIENLQCSFLEWVTRDELEMVLQNYLNVVKEVNDTSAVNSKYHCLMCGKPKNNLAGMLIAPPKRTTNNSNTVHKPTPVQRASYDMSSNSMNNPNYSVPPRNVVDFLTQ